MRESLYLNDLGVGNGTVAKKKNLRKRYGQPGKMNLYQELCFFLVALSKNAPQLHPRPDSDRHHSHRTYKKKSKLHGAMETTW